MSTLIKAKIDVKKIRKDLLFTGDKGTYLDVDIWINDKKDKFDNDVSIEQSVKKDEPKIYIGNGKIKWSTEGGSVKSEKTVLDAAKDTAEFRQSLNENDDDLPF
jgi:hypothetical protein